MGRFIDEILQPGEQVLYSTNAHWTFYVPAIAVWIVALILLILSRTAVGEGLVLLCRSASAVVAIVALYWTGKAWFHRWTTETDVTNRRVVPIAADATTSHPLSLKPAIAPRFCGM